MIGDSNDFIGRIKAVLPQRWFPDTPGSPTAPTTPVLTAILSGAAAVGAWMYGVLAYIKLQTRIKTATDVFLDMIAFDYFGIRVARGINQTDSQFRNRILLELLRERGTRNGLNRVLIDLTGRTPIIFEPARPADTGAYGVPPIGGGLAWNTGPGGWGSLAYPYQCFVTAFRPKGLGIPNVAGWGTPTGAWNTGSQLEYASLSMIAGQVKDSDIYAAIDSVKPVATTVWTRIQS